MAAFVLYNLGLSSTVTGVRLSKAARSLVSPLALDMLVSRSSTMCLCSCSPVRMSSLTVSGCVQAAHLHAPATTRGLSSWAGHYNCQNSRPLTFDFCCSTHFNPSVKNGSPCHMIWRRNYAKGKSKGKDKGKGSVKVVELSAEELDGVIDSEKLQQQLAGQLEHLKNEFTQQLSLRTSIGAFDSLTIDTQDGKFPLIQLGQVTQKGNQTIVVNMTSNPQYIPNVKSALTTSMSLNPQQDGTTLFINIPKITKEHREGLAKSAKTMCEKTKVKLREVQNKHLQTLKKSKSNHSEDVIFSVQNHIQQEVKRSSEKADQMTAIKQKELLGSK